MELGSVVLVSAIFFFCLDSGTRFLCGYLNYLLISTRHASISTLNKISCSNISLLECFSCPRYPFFFSFFFIGLDFTLNYEVKDGDYFHRILARTFVADEQPVVHRT